MCTFVPFVHTSYVLINTGEDASIPVDRLNLAEKENDDNSSSKYQLSSDPPLKKMCSGTHQIACFILF